MTEQTEQFCLLYFYYTSLAKLNLTFNNMCSVYEYGSLLYITIHAIYESNSNCYM